MALKNQSFLLFLVILVLGCFAFQSVSRPLDDNDNALSSMKERHEQWMAKYGRTYKDIVEKQKRFKIFKENVERIEKFNREALSNHKLYTLEVNKFADLSQEEFIATHTGSKSSKLFSDGLSTTSFMHENVTDIPPSLDWNQQGAVTPIKNQKDCGCCWAFATVAAVEGLNFIKTRNLVSLSEQDLVDCDTKDDGCEGGLMITAFQFIHDNNGIVTEDAYPYANGVGQCMENSLEGQRVTVQGYEVVPPNNEDALLQAVSQQPVVVRVDSNGLHGLQFFNTGIYNGNDCGNELNHEITITGYGTDENGVDYWIAKNQWGTDWGENGFLKIQRGLNVCGLASQPAYPI